MGSVPRVQVKGGGTCFGNNVAEMDEGSPGGGETKRSLMEGRGRGGIPSVVWEFRGLNSAAVRVRGRPVW